MALGRNSGKGSESTATLETALLPNHGKELKDAGW